MEWVAQITGDNGEKIKIGIEKTDRGFEVVLENGDDPVVAPQKTYDEAIEAISISWYGDVWELEWLNR